MNFLSFCLRLGSRRFVLKHHVIKNIFENKVGIGYMYDNKQLLTPKKDVDYYRLFSRKLVWFGIIWVSHPKIDLWGIFPTQLLSLNIILKSELRNDHKHRIFWNFRKVPLKLVFFQVHCPKINHFHSNLPVYCGCVADYGFWPFFKS